LSDHRVNERIRAREVRLIDPDGKQLGVKPLPEALAIARQLDLDLVEVAPDANPPVCRIMDYNRFKYESAQRAKESRKKATSTSIKEMKYRPKIGSGDFTTKTRQVARFLEEGHKVKVTIMFRGREVSHPELGMKILDDLAEQVSSVAKVEAAPKLDGRNMVMVLAPDRRARQATRRTTDLAPGTGAPSTEPEPDASAPGGPETAGPETAGPETAGVLPAGPGAADIVPPASAPTGAPSTGAPERVEAPVGSANGAVPPARQPATVAASAPAASRTSEGNLASHTS
jgi:translation initiation factor IF-3